MSIVQKIIRQSKKGFNLGLLLVLLFNLFWVIKAEPTSWKDTSPGSNGDVNLFTGKLNFTTPLISIAGRGKSGYTIPLSIQNNSFYQINFSEPHTINFPGEGFTTTCIVTTTNSSRSYQNSNGQTETERLTTTDISFCSSAPAPSITIPLDPYQFHFVGNNQKIDLFDPGYDPGVLYAKYDNRYKEDTNQSTSNNITNIGVGRTTLIFRTPDGSTQTFMDTGTMGQYKHYDLVNGDFVYPTRGKNFTSIDGSSTTFISDTPINDGAPVLYAGESLPRGLFPDGYMITKDGTKYRIEKGLIRWILDTDGNKTTFSYLEPSTYDAGSPRKLLQVTDSMGRIININYDINDGILSPDGTPYGLRDEIVYKSIGGEDKKVIITKTNLGNSLRTGFNLKRYDELWSVPFLSPTNSQIYSQQVVSGIWKENKSTKFKYDSYGNLARIEYPTGGAVEYDYEPQTDYGVTESLGRRVTESRIFSSNASESLVNKTRYSNIYPTNLYNTPTPITTLPIQVDILDPGDNLLSRSKHYFKSDPLNLSLTNEVTKEHGWEDDLTGKEIKTEIINPQTQNIYQRIEYNWQMRVQGVRSFCPINQACGLFREAPLNEIPSRDPILVETKTTTFENGTNLVSKTSAINPSTGAYAFDENNNQTDSWVYDYGVGNPGRLLKHSQTSYLKVNPSNGVNYANPNSGSDYTSSDPHIIGLPETNKLFDVQPNGSEALISQSETRYDESAYPIINAGTATGWSDPNTVARGSATTARVWNITNNSWVETHAQFDNFGNTRKAWDAKGNVSEAEFSSTYNYAYPTKTKSVAPDPSGQNGSNIPFESTTTYDFYTGLPLSTTDANGQTSTMEYNDPLLRPTKVIPPAGGAQTIKEYGDIPGNLYVKTKSQIDETNWAEATSYFDNLGRTVKSQKKDLQGDVFTDTIYDNLGRVKQVTNPYRTGETQQWTTTNYDEVGRVKEIGSPDGTKVQTAYGISTVPNFIGTFTVGIDQAGKSRRSITNSLGQLVRVDEPDDSGNLGTIDTPIQPTYYSYSPQGQMVKVQQGVQNRYFLYDGLGRLLRVHQPEQDTNANLALNDGITGNSQWTAGFTYDVNGNILTATDAKGVTITNSYDNANRLLTITYSDGTPVAAYKYDDANIPYSKGKLTRSENSISASQVVAFDNLGRVLTSQQIVPSSPQIPNDVTFQSSYTYNLAGALIEETYPSGRKVKNTFAVDGDLAKVETQISNGSYQTRAQSFAYSPSGAIAQLQIGNGLWETAQFNNRLQVTQLGLGTSATDTSIWKLNYEFGELDGNGNTNQAKNAGNITKQIITSPAGTFTQSFVYDSLDRLKSAQEVSGGNQIWVQNFAYDRYGNRTGFNQTILGQTVSQTPAIDVNTNRFTTGQGFTYDFNGNLINDYQGRQFIFNGDNKQVEVKDSNNNTIGQYFYDADGKRVKKISNSEITLFAYSGGKLVAEYSVSQNTSQNPTTQYLGTDILDSTRVITNQNAQVVSRRDFMPFGEDLPRTNYGSDNLRQKFTGYQKDTETGLDFAKARYYNNAHGRFTAVDPLLASGKSANPQTFNRYIYTGNNPIVIADPLGLDWYSKGNQYQWFDNKPAGDEWNLVNFNGSYYKYNCDGCAVGQQAYLYRTSGWDYGERAKVYDSLQNFNDYGSIDPKQLAVRNSQVRAAAADAIGGITGAGYNAISGTYNMGAWGANRFGASLPYAPEFTPETGGEAIFYYGTNAVMIARGGASLLKGGINLFNRGKNAYTIWQNSKVIMWRGTSSSADIAAIESGILESKAARAGIPSTKLNTSLPAKMWHSITSDKPLSQFISITSREGVARRFGTNVYEFQVRRGDLTRAWWNPFGEAEYLANNGTGISDVIKH